MFFPGTPKRPDYAPPLKKRFELSDDPFTRERVAWLRTYQKELTNRFGFPIGLGVFGSLVKGKPLTQYNASKTDIDLEVSFLLPSDEAIKKHFKPRSPYLFAGADIELNDFDPRYYFTLFKDYVWARIQNEQHPFPVETHIHGYIDTEEHFTEITRGLVTANEETATPSFLTWNDFASSFEVDVGESLKPIRQRVLYSLRNYLSDEERPGVWSQLIDEIAGRDRRSLELVKTWLPQTFEQAEQRYGTVKPGTVIDSPQSV